MLSNPSPVKLPLYRGVLSRFNKLIKPFFAPHVVHLSKLVLSFCPSIIARHCIAIQCHPWRVTEPPRVPFRTHYYEIKVPFRKELHVTSISRNQAFIWPGMHPPKEISILWVVGKTHRHRKDFSRN